MPIVTIGDRQLNYDYDGAKQTFRLRDLYEIFYGGRKSSRSIIYQRDNKKNGVIISRKFGQGGNSDFITLETFFGSFCKEIPKGSQEFLRAAEFIKVMRSLGPGDLLPEHIPEPVSIGIDPCS